ncbi:MAG: isochorismatase family protein [Acidobacteriota bacterium]
MGTADSPDGATRDLYANRGFLGRVGFGTRPAILVIDFILGFTDTTSPLASDFDAEIAATRQLIDAARTVGAPVYFTTTAYDAECREAGVFVEKVPSLRWLIRGSRWVELDPRLGRRPDDVLIEKQFASAFFGTPLAALLNAQSIDTVVIAGATTSGCVRASAVDSLQYGFRTIVPRECVGDRAIGPHEANLLDIDGKYGDVVGVADAVAALSGSR